MISTPVRILAGAGAVLGWMSLVVPVRNAWEPGWSEASTLLELGPVPALALAVGTAVGILPLLRVGDRITRWWGILAILVALLQAAIWFTLTQVSWLFWDGVDQQGNPTGGAVAIGIWFGWGYLALASAFLLAAGIGQILSSRRERAGAAPR